MGQKYLDLEKFKESLDASTTVERLEELACDESRAIRIVVALHPKSTDEIALQCDSYGDTPNLLSKRKAGATQEQLLEKGYPTFCKTMQDFLVEECSFKI